MGLLKKIKEKIIKGVEAKESVVTNIPQKVSPERIVDVVFEKPLRLTCPNCNAYEEFIIVNKDRNEYKCGNCNKGYSGYPPPK